MQRVSAWPSAHILACTSAAACLWPCSLMHLVSVCPPFNIIRETRLAHGHRGPDGRHLSVWICAAECVGQKHGSAAGWRGCGDSQMGPISERRLCSEQENASDVHGHRHRPGRISGARLHAMAARSGPPAAGCGGFCPVSIDPVTWSLLITLGAGPSACRAVAGRIRTQTCAFIRGGRRRLGRDWPWARGGWPTTTAPPTTVGQSSVPPLLARAVGR